MLLPELIVWGIVRICSYFSNLTRNLFGYLLVEIRISIKAFEILCFSGEENLEVNKEIDQRKETNIRFVHNSNLLVFLNLQMKRINCEFPLSKTKCD